MRKSVLVMGLVALFSISGCTEPQTQSGNPNTPEYINEWKPSETTTVVAGGKEYKLRGEEINKEFKLALLDKDFKLKTENSTTWFIWEDDKVKREKLLGSKVEIYGISQTTEEKELLAATEVTELDGNLPIQLIDEHLAVQFNAPIELPEEGKWKLQVFIEDQLYGVVKVSTPIKI
ncbi:hypothetical protein LC040_03115 [Bacillus tianshenii]|nr:hypothetical protein LC040_03115 [Bacillus tianshenii]